MKDHENYVQGKSLTMKDFFDRILILEGAVTDLRESLKETLYNKIPRDFNKHVEVLKKYSKTWEEIYINGKAEFAPFSKLLNTSSGEAGQLKTKSKL